MPKSSVADAARFEVQGVRRALERAIPEGGSMSDGAPSVAEKGQLALLTIALAIDSRVAFGYRGGRLVRSRSHDRCRDPLAAGPSRLSLGARRLPSAPIPLDSRTHNLNWVRESRRQMFVFKLVTLHS
jgi:hypothetical protein